MFDKLYEFILSFIKYLSFSRHKKLSDLEDNLEDNVEINLKYDEIYNIENPFIM